MTISEANHGASNLDLYDKENSMRLMLERNAYREALWEIQQVLDDPRHGAYHSDLWSMVNTVLQTGKRGE